MTEQTITEQTITEQTITEQTITEVKYCKDLLGICFTSPDCEEDQYFHAFSFDNKCLEQMIQNNVKEYEQQYYSIKKIKLFKYYFVMPSKETDIFFDKKNTKGILLPFDDEKYDEKLFPIYGFNRIIIKIIKNDIYELCEQVLLSIKPESIIDYIKECGISHNPILIDTFYEESILNA